ncbi:MAG: ABC transporter ATP-binding protein [Candidatus Eisenbacteria bacterium]|uniref:ABC transporter ATP-binding protein n=1 Tax=Eiseniibacteriota bacterium TaxID=2212470 RepID=A0A948RWL1_UNCEI|nr:ABC transporter ATP-binding protein [Candidatus Eisenbacteria bacterium]MBU1951219.1 ABC transporter ATP-binding protein [Candidatus Eisenbacteria bacterium]MBU2692358.1 ABC transporter ATP-binding protein [Candidatus Eisenbacteria bacterium]
MLSATGLTRIFRLGGQEIRAVDGVDLEIREGEYTRITGASGSGKSTLLNLLAGLDTPSSGCITTPEGVLSDFSSRRLAAYRAHQVGMVFQSFNLIPHRTALQNVELGMLFLGRPRAERHQRAEEILARLGLADRLHHRPNDLSGGEQQRVSLARALAKQPKMLMADEPTGNLDRDTSIEISRLLKELNAEGLTVILVTHDTDLAVSDAHRTLKMSYGKIVEETPRQSI